MQLLECIVRFPYSIIDKCFLLLWLSFQNECMSSCLSQYHNDNWGGGGFLLPGQNRLCDVVSAHISWVTRLEELLYFKELHKRKSLNFGSPCPSTAALPPLPFELFCFAGAGKCDFSPSCLSQHVVAVRRAALPN